VKNHALALCVVLNLERHRSEFAPSCNAERTDAPRPLARQNPALQERAKRMPKGVLGNCGAFITFRDSDVQD
jgi:hypothetical protein